MTTQGVMGCVRGAVRKVRTYSVRGSSGVPMFSMFAGTTLAAIAAMAARRTSPPRLRAIVRNDSHARWSVWRNRVPKPNVCRTSGTETAPRARPLAAGGGACAPRRRAARLHHGLATAWAKRKRAKVNASAASAMPIQRRRLDSSGPRSSIRRVLFSIGVHPRTRSEVMYTWPKTSSSAASSRCPTYRPRMIIPP